jgi:hypothetical protein
VILKGSQRANGADLARHLMNGFDNESIEVAEVHGTVAEDLSGALAEIEAVSRGTRAKNYLYSLSINPPSPLTREQYFEAIAAIEKRLGLAGQPRAVVFHVKPDDRGISREHCHVVWSRIDIQKMRPIHMAHDHRRLMDLACELARKYGLDLPPGLKAWEAKQNFEKEKLDPTLAERAQQQATGIRPEQRRDEITAAYEASDSHEAFRAALEEKGYVLAKGDKRGFVVVDKFGDVHSLTRYVKGHKAGAIKTKLAPLTPEQLPSVDEAKELVRRRAQAQGEAQREQQQARTGDVERERQRLEALRRQKESELAERAAVRALELQQAEQELLTRQQQERLALHAAQKSESSGFLFRVRSAVADLIRRTPALRSVIGHIQKLTQLDPRERHQLESEALARRHAREKLDIERCRRMNAAIDTRERQSLEKFMRKAQRLQEAARLERERATEQARTVDNKAMQDFHDAARDLGLWKERQFKEGELRETFNDAAEFAEGADKGGDDDDSYAPDWKDDADDDGDDKGPKLRPRRGKGYGYRRDSD